MVISTKTIKFWFYSFFVNIIGAGEVLVRSEKGKDPSNIFKTTETFVARKDFDKDLDNPLSLGLCVVTKSLFGARDSWYLCYSHMFNGERTEKNLSPEFINVRTGERLSFEETRRLFCKLYEYIPQEVNVAVHLMKKFGHLNIQKQPSDDVDVNNDAPPEKSNILQFPKQPTVH